MYSCHGQVDITGAYQQIRAAGYVTSFADLLTADTKQIKLFEQCVLCAE
jgi:hypothetical protein